MPSRTQLFASAIEAINGLPNEPGLQNKVKFALFNTAMYHVIDSLHPEIKQKYREAQHRCFTDEEFMYLFKQILEGEAAFYANR